MNLKKQTIYTEIDVNVELPIESKYFFTIKPFDVGMYCPLLKKFLNSAKYWLKKEEKYVLSEEEIRELLNKASDFGREYVNKTGKLWNDTEKAYQIHKEEYINKILNNE